MKKVIAILRCSTLKQDLESQKVDLTSFISMKGYTETDIHWITGEGASAFKIDDSYKEMVKEMMNYITSNTGIEAVFAWAINRLGRDEIELHKIRKFLVEHKTQLYIKEPSLYLLNEDGTENGGMSLAFSMFATMSRQQIEELVAKGKRTKSLNSKLGKFNGGGDVKAGYTVDKDGYIIKDTSSDLIQTIFKEYSTGSYSTITLSKELTDRGYTKPSGKPLTSRFITKILCDESYTGKSSDTGRSYPALISQALYDKCVEVRKDNSKGDVSKETKHNYFGVKILKCYECGTNLVANNKHYRCWKHYSPEGNCTNGYSIRIDFIDGLLSRIAYDEEVSSYVNQRVNNEKEYLKELSVVIKKISKLNDLISSVDSLKKKVQAGYENGVYSDTEYTKRLKDIDSNCATHKNKVLELEENKKRLEALLDTPDTFDDRLKCIWSKIGSITEEQEWIKIIRKHIKEASVKPNGQFTLITVRLYSGENLDFVYLPFCKKGHYCYQVKGDIVSPYDVQLVLRDPNTPRPNHNYDPKTTFKIIQKIKDSI